MPEHFTRRLLVPILLLAFLSACEGEVEWLDYPPPELQGLWIEVSDDVTIGLDIPDTISIRRNMLWTHQYLGDDAPFNRSCRIRRVARQNVGFRRQTSRFVVFCGPPNPDHFADLRFQFDVEGPGLFATVSEIVATGVNNDYAEFYLGRFTVHRMR